MKTLIEQLKQIDGKGYKAYKSVQGHYKYRDFDLYIDYVQGDPFATPSKIRVVVDGSKKAINPDWLRSQSRKVAVEDTIARSVGNAVVNDSTNIKGSGKSGAILVDQPGQEILERTAVQVTKQGITICLSVGLPANGRRINGRDADKLFTAAIPTIIQNSVFSITDELIFEAVYLADQQDAIREEMKKHNWIAFIANGSILPRESGISNRPLQNAVLFQSPIENEVSLELPHRSQPLKGMAINSGITLIVGGGYHGKSTLLEAIERGVYPHAKGDGREYVLTDPKAVKIRAEDGRQVTGVNISPFIRNLPHGQQTENFSTENASGSTSQAANVMESLEVGATTLLIDEDTSATNFMIRDERMKQLVSQEKEPITPLIDKIKQLHDQLKISTILVMGGSGDYFDVADTIVMMDEYRPRNVTDQAKQITKKNPVQKNELLLEFGSITERIVEQKTLQTKKGARSKTQAKGPYKILMGRTEITFEHTEQLIDPSQTRMIAEIIQYLDRTNGLGKKTLAQLLDDIERQMDRSGLASFTIFKHQHPGDLARPRRFEIAAVLNRMRTASIKQQ